MSVQKLAESPVEDPLSQLPEGAELETSTGKVTRRQLYRVRGFDMPWLASPAEAVRTYLSLKKSYENGFFVGGHKAKPSATAAVAA